MWLQTWQTSPDWGQHIHIHTLKYMGAISPSSRGRGIHSRTMCRLWRGLRCVSMNTQSRSWDSNIRTRVRRNSWGWQSKPIAIQNQRRHFSLDWKDFDWLTWISDQTSSSSPVAAQWCCRGQMRQWPSVIDTPAGRLRYTWTQHRKHGHNTDYIYKFINNLQFFSLGQL